MRTALVLLLLLALAAIPGSVIPQSGVDSLKTSRWQDAHPQLTPVYERLGLFSVYDSPWFSAIYLLLMVSLVGCIVPRTCVYWRGAARRAAAPPRATCPGCRTHASYTTALAPAEVLGRRAAGAARRRYRVLEPTMTARSAPSAATCARPATCSSTSRCWWCWWASPSGGLFGYKGGVILVVGNGFSNNLTQYDDFVPGQPVPGRPTWSRSASTSNDFDVTWLTSGPPQGHGARVHLPPDLPRVAGAAPEKTYDLKVNHPLTIGGTEVFLIGHGYAPVITIRDGNGDVAYSGPTIFLPTDQTFRSFGVVKAPDAEPTQIGLEGEFYPTYAFTDAAARTPPSATRSNPAISMLAYTGDLGMDDGAPQSVYSLDKASDQAGDQARRLDVPRRPAARQAGRAAERARARSRFDGVAALEQDPDQPDAGQARSRSPASCSPCSGCWARCSSGRGGCGCAPGVERTGRTLVEVAGLDRSGGGDVSVTIAELVAAAARRARAGPRRRRSRDRRTSGRP